MKCFTVSERTVELGLSVKHTPYPHVGIGEEGRGRTYVRFPIGRRFAESLGDSKIYEARVLRTKERGTLMLVEDNGTPDNRALVHIAVEAGYRGSTTWTSTTYQMSPCPNRGKDAYTWLDGCPRCGAKYQRDDSGPMPRIIHPREGNVRSYDPFPGSGITILAEGYHAQGAAGRMGGHTARLVILEPGATLRIKRAGRLYGAPSEIFILWDGEHLRVGPEDVVFPPTNEAEEGVFV